MDGTFVEWVMAGGIVTISVFSIATYRYVGKMKDETDKRIDRNYSRFDEVKSNMDSSYTRKDVCAILHTQVTNSLTEIKAGLKAVADDVTTLLRHNGAKKDG